MHFAFQLCLLWGLLIPPVNLSIPVDEPEKAVLAAAEAYVNAFNARDAEKLAQLWSEDATYVLPDTGQRLVGRDAIRESFARMFADSESDSGKLTITIESIRFITPDVAMETGKSQVARADGTVSVGSYSAIYVKKNDQWLLDSIHDTEEQPADSFRSPISELGWLVGEWVDQSETSTVETTCQWTKNSHFLTRSFRVSAPGTEEFEGTQIIGWDPVSNQIRSWVFDSEGGFSTGHWKRQGESWVVETSGYTVDGQLVNSIQVFQPKDANSFSWQSFGRRIGDERLPNIDEILVTRKQ